MQNSKYVNQDTSKRSEEAHFTTMMMEVVSSSETSVNFYRIIWRYAYIPKKYS
jgi:hypothetical protein